ncbi:hypothetical protein JI435_405000 [Parastagonospora nodorum SN15]|uniref:Uncharacterized protein n=1 Tax=Phaeosphaeria nodorum (strain SN15 / ATCC MYA-4574 / FGSC 10173) TaxID=321614 RepID=A0A7U2HZ61_PHANO|nr:hypothetical protein JI435_405000 [Parastagonospora nodorum SN15]
MFHQVSNVTIISSILLLLLKHIITSCFLSSFVLSLRYSHF